jgi:DnaJ-domain-containing protein 1
MRSSDPQFPALLLEELHAHPAGISEHRLLRALAQRDVEDLAAGPPGDALALFRRHFRLFHALYRLRSELRTAGTFDLDIHCLSVRLRPHAVESTTLPELEDRLAAYYLDASALERTTAEEAQRLVDSGFAAVLRLGRREDALAVLGLRDPVSDDEIRRRYRALAHRYHPDRGGCVQRFQELGQAMAELRT